MSNTFKVFAELKESSGTSTVLTDAEFDSSTERQNGSVPGTVIKSKLNNTGLREATLLSTALINALEELDKRTNLVITYSPLEDVSTFSTKIKNVLKSFTSDYTDSQISTLNTSLTNLINNCVKFISQSLTDAQKTQARQNIGASDGTWNSITGKPSFSTVATSGSYSDLSDKPKFYHNIVTLSASIYEEYEGEPSFYGNAYPTISFITTKSSLTLQDIYNLSDGALDVAGGYVLHGNGYFTITNSYKRGSSTIDVSFIEGTTMKSGMNLEDVSIQYQTSREIQL